MQSNVIKVDFRKRKRKDKVFKQSPDDICQMLYGNILALELEDDLAKWIKESGSINIIFEKSTNK